MAKGAPEPQQSGGGDRSLDFLWLVVLVVAAGLLIWYFGNVYIAMGAFTIKQYEILAIKFVMRFWLNFATIFALPNPVMTDLDKWLEFIKQNYGNPVEFQSLVSMSTTTGIYLKFPAALALLILGLLLYFGGIAQQFQHIYSMNSLKKDEQKNWPQYSPIAKYDLVNEQLDEQPWAVALSPLRFCKKYNLLNEEIGKDGKRIISLRQGAAYRVLSLQLGPRWRGIEVLPDYLQALFAIFTARMNGDKKVADELMDKIAASSGAGKPSFYDAATLARKYATTKQVQRVASLHGYVTTVFASLLIKSREAGVLSTAEIIWLKPLDRRMWYMLNSVGRYTPTAEIAGAFAHWLAERKLGLPLMVPMVEEAIRGMEIALSEILYKPEED